MKLCSIIVVNWNTGGLLRTCLGRIAETAGDIPHEIIVVDNGSTDGSQDMIRREFPRVTFIALQDNIGFVRANNLGLEAAAGDCVLFLNPDTEVRPGALQNLLRVLDDRSGVGAVGPQLLNTDGTRQLSIFRFPSVFSIVLEHLISARLFGWWERVYSRRRPEGPVDVIRGASLLVRKVVLEKTGPMDERLFMFAEETDLCRRIRDAGYAVWYDPNAYVVHHGGESMRRQRSAFVSYHYHRSKMILIRTHFTPRSATLAIRAIHWGLRTRLVLGRILGSASVDMVGTVLRDLAHDPGWGAQSA